MAELQLRKLDTIVIRRFDCHNMIVAITVPHEDNVLKGKKYKKNVLYFSHEIIDIWNVDSVIIISIVLCSRGLITKNLE